MQHVYAYKFVVLCLALFLYSTQAFADEYQQQRDILVSLIEKDVGDNSEFLDSNRLTEEVIKAIRTVPRHEFVPLKNRHQAYKNRPLPIGYGQTSSQPTIVAIMTDLLHLKNTDRVLEVGSTTRRWSTMPTWWSLPRDPPIVSPRSCRSSFAPARYWSAWSPASTPRSYAR